MFKSGMDAIGDAILVSKNGLEMGTNFLNGKFRRGVLGEQTKEIFDGSGLLGNSRLST